MLIHRKSGADRAGLMSALYLDLKEGVPMAQAKRQLSLR
jgi:protein tyrosine/serine phosphatase